MIKVNSIALGQINRVRLTLDIEESAVYGYGYGNIITDFFDVLGVEGSESGVTTEMVDGEFGFGYEYTGNIAGVNRQRKATLTVIPDEDVVDSFFVQVTIVGQGYSNVYSGETDGANKFVFYVQDFDNHIDEYFKYYHENLRENADGTTSVVLSPTFSLGNVEMSDTDGFFDIIVDVKNTVQPDPKIKVKAQVETPEISQPIKILINARLEE